MKKKKENYLVKSSFSLAITLVSCLTVFAIAIAGMIAAFNYLMSQHDKKLSSEICNLISEKMNSSIRYMTDSAQNMASVLSAQNFDSPEEIYQVLSQETSGSYVSLGFIDKDRKIYASEQELKEFDKWDLLSTALLADPVSISAPYRSGATGQPVFTMFTHFTYHNQDQGWMFITYPLAEIQNIAASESLKESTEIWLMNAKSLNIIQCAGDDVYSIGSWANAHLAMGNINPSDTPAYEEWCGKMLTGEPTASLGYSIGKTAYTQIYSAIDHMPGWFIVVRIPRSALSATMSRFRGMVLIFIFVLLAVTVTLIVLMYQQNAREKKILEQLSIHDSLTSVMNRRAFDFAAEQRLSRSTKEAMLLFFDVDYFKQVNDRFGHDAGDRILVEFSGALKKHFGEMGLISRYGGDEFVVLLDTASKQDVTNLLDSMTKDTHAIHPTDDPEKNKNFMLSFSAGAACFPEDAENLDDLKQCADVALYDVKNRGRNGYCWYHPKLEYLK